VQTPAGISTVVSVVLIWAAVLLVLVVGLALATRRRRAPVAGRPVRAERRATVAGDRRTVAADRRIGLPDPRPERVERRSGDDRRSGARDRRRALDLRGGAPGIAPR
jgi:hypothetical protein